MKTIVASLSLAVLVMSGPAFAASAVGQTDDCVRLQDIKETPTIDDHTILLKLRNGFKRVDLQGRCPGLEFGGFSHVTHDETLCRYSVLNVLSNGNSPCLIDKIVTIDENEAKALEAKRVR